MDVIQTIRRRGLPVFLSLALCAGLVAPALALDITQQYVNENSSDGYFDLKGADDNTYNMVEDIKTDSTFRASEGGQVTLNMNGHELDHGGAAGSVIEVTGEGTKLTINADNEETGEKGVITGGTGTAYHHSVFDATVGGGIYVHDDASFEMNGGEVSNNTADIGATLAATDVNDIILREVNSKGNTAEVLYEGLHVENADTVELINYTGANESVEGPVNSIAGTVKQATISNSSLEESDFRGISKVDLIDVEIKELDAQGCDKINFAVTEHTDKTLVWYDKDGNEITEMPEGGRVDGMYSKWENEDPIPTPGGGQGGGSSYEGPAEVEIDDPETPLAAGPVTRAQFVDYLWRHEGRIAAAAPTFSDTADHELADAIGWAQANGLVFGGGDNTFSPDDLITVSALRAILTRWAALLGMEMPELTTLTGGPDDPVLNCDEVLAEFFGK